MLLFTANVSPHCSQFYPHWDQRRFSLVVKQMKRVPVLEGIWCCWLTSACPVLVAHDGTNEGLVCSLAMWQNPLSFFLERAIFKCSALPRVLASLGCLTTFSSVSAYTTTRFQPFSNNRLHQRQTCLSLWPVSQKNYQEETSLESENMCSEPQWLFS